MCALEMAALEIQGNGDTGTIVTEENIRKTIESLDDVQQKDFIRKCLQVDPLSRPSARELLFHPVLFEVHSLKLLAAHALVNSASKSTGDNSSLQYDTTTSIFCSYRVCHFTTVVTLEMKAQVLKRVLKRFFRITNSLGNKYADFSGP